MYYTTLAEYDEAIAGVRRAISLALQGASYSLTKGGVSVSRSSHSLTDLYKLLAALQAEREALAGGLSASGGFALARNVRRYRDR